MNDSRLLVTGATGMLGSFVARRAVELGYKVRVLGRANSDRTLIQDLDVEYVVGDLTQPESLPKALEGVDVGVHCAVQSGDWGPAEKYRAANVVALEHLLTAAERAGSIRRWIHVSTLGVYPKGHHHGTDETAPIDLGGFDGYTQTKAEAEVVVRRHIDEYDFPAVILRPGFIYGPGERHVIPRLLKRFEQGLVKFIGDGQKVLNNVYVGNFVDAVFLALEHPDAVGEIYNIRDERLVTRDEYLTMVAEYLGKPHPRHVPLWLAQALVPVVEGVAKLRGRQDPPLLTRATIKFMAMNLNFSIAKAKAELGYRPAIDFQPGMRDALDWATGKMTTPRLLRPADQPSA